MNLKVITEPLQYEIEVTRTSEEIRKEFMHIFLQWLDDQASLHGICSREGDFYPTGNHHESIRVEFKVSVRSIDCTTCQHFVKEKKKLWDPKCPFAPNHGLGANYGPVRDVERERTCEHYNQDLEFCIWKKADYGSMGCESYEWHTTCNQSFDCNRLDRPKYCPVCGKLTKC